MWLRPLCLSFALLTSPLPTTPMVKRPEKASHKVTITKDQAQEALWTVNWEMKRTGQSKDVFLKSTLHQAFHVSHDQFLSFFNTNPQLAQFKSKVTANGKWPLFEQKFYNWLKGVNPNDQCSNASDWDAEGAVYKTNKWWEWKIMSDYLN